MQLSAPQQEVLDMGLLQSGFNCILQMPTGSGKTWLAEQAIRETLRQSARVIYLTPLRALATELQERWQVLFKDAAVGVFTGDYGTTTPYPLSFDKSQLLVMTPERLDACTRAWRSHWHWIPAVDVVIVDEFHLLGDRHRGARLEGTLSRFRRLNPFTRIIGLSATLGNRQELADWLEGVEYHSNWRPIPLRWHIVRYKRADEKPGLLLEQASRNVREGGKSLVFVQSRRRAEHLSQQLQSAGLRAEHHHAGLKHQQRRSIEEGFRQGRIDVLVATSTLEMGLNLPVRQVVLYDLQCFDGVEFQPLSTNSVWQRVGRAGRRGLDTEGEALLLAPTWDRHVEQYPQGKFEPIRSGLSDPRALAEQVVAEVASGMARSLPQLKSVFGQSLAAQQQRLPKVETLVDEMQQAGMLEAVVEEDENRPRHRLRATRLGHIAVRHFLSPATVLLFRNMLQAHPDLTFLDLLLIAASSSDCEPVLPVDFEELDGLVQQLEQEPSILLGYANHELVSLLGISGKRLLAALRMAVVARAWTRLGNVDEVATQNNCYAFEVERLCESLVRLLLAMYALTEKERDDTAVTIRPHDIIPLRERIRVLQQMIASGLDEAAITLTLIPGLGPKLAQRLQQADIHDIEDFASADLAELLPVRGLSAARAKRWIDEATKLTKSRSAYCYKEAVPQQKLTLPNWPSHVDPYRLRRALDLKITGAEAGTYRVIGGVEPHVLRTVARQLICDCQDTHKAAAQGYECKHILAVKRWQGNRQIQSLAKQLCDSPVDQQLNLFALWFDHDTSKVQRKAA